MLLVGHIVQSMEQAQVGLTADVSLCDSEIRTQHVCCQFLFKHRHILRVVKNLEKRQE